MNATSVRCLISFEPRGQVDPVSWTPLNYSCPGHDWAPPCPSLSLLCPSTRINPSGVPSPRTRRTLFVSSRFRIFIADPRYPRGNHRPISRGTTATEAATCRDSVYVITVSHTGSSLGGRTRGRSRRWLLLSALVFLRFFSVRFYIWWG